MTVVNATNLADHRRAITKKESKELEKKTAETQAKCDAFVRQSPGHPVSTEFAYEVKGFAAYYVRCESFCGTESDRLREMMKDVSEATPSHK